MKNVAKIFSVLAIVSLAAFSPKNSEVQSAPAQLDAMVASMTSVKVIKDWGACHQLSECWGAALLYADYTGSAPFQATKNYDIYYYSGGSCGIVVTSVYEIGPC